MIYTFFSNLLLELVAQASPFSFPNLIDFTNLVHLIDGTVALMVLLLSAYMALTSLICGGNVIEVWGASILIVIDFFVQFLVSGSSDKAFGGAIRDAFVLVFGFLIGDSLKNARIKFLILLFFLVFPIVGWSWNGVISRCAGKCFYLRVLH